MTKPLDTSDLPFLRAAFLAQAKQDDPQAPARGLGLALAVVTQALDDIAIAGRRKGQDLTQDHHARNATNAAEDAKDFLLRRLWEPGNPWGELLRIHGAKGFAKARLCHAVRKVELTR